MPFEVLKDQQGFPRTLSAEEVEIWKAWMKYRCSELAKEYEVHGDAEIVPFSHYKDFFIPRKIREDLKFHRMSKTFDHYEIWTRWNTWNPDKSKVLSPPEESMLLGIQKGQSGEGDQYFSIGRWSLQHLTPFDQVKERLAAKWRQKNGPGAKMRWALGMGLAVVVLLRLVLNPFFTANLWPTVVTLIFGLVSGVWIYQLMSHFNSEETDPLMQAIKKTTKS